MKQFLFIILFILQLFFNNNTIYAMNDTILLKSESDLKGDIISFKDNVYSARNLGGKIENKNFISSNEYKIINDTILIVTSKIPGTINNYFYNSFNKLSEIITNSTSDGSIKEKHIIYYDTSNKYPKLKLKYNSNKKLQDSIIITFNKDKKELQETSYSTKNGNVLYTIVKRFNDNGQIDKKVRTTNESNIRFLYKYDSINKKIIDEQWFLNNKIVQKIKYIYNDKAKIIKQIEYDEEKIRHQLEYTYDPIYGVLLEIISKEHITKYEYNFDNNGNWIVRYEFYDGFPVKITERKIEYKK